MAADSGWLRSVVRAEIDAHRAASHFELGALTA
jgi:hypothetical protein